MNFPRHRTNHSFTAKGQMSVPQICALPASSGPYTYVPLQARSEFVGEAPGRRLWPMASGPETGGWLSDLPGLDFRGLRLPTAGTSAQGFFKREAAATRFGGHGSSRYHGRSLDLDQSRPQEGSFKAEVVSLPYSPQPLPYGLGGCTTGRRSPEMRLNAVCVRGKLFPTHMFSTCVYTYTFRAGAYHMTYGWLSKLWSLFLSLV